MQMLNRYFTPFALILILSAIYFSQPDPRDYKLSLLILLSSILINWWLSKNVYRIPSLARHIRKIQVWINFIWAIPLFYLLQPYWGPMWLLFVMAPVTAALYFTFWQTFSTATFVSSTMLAIYWKRGVFDGGPDAGMVFVEAAFIVIFSLFVHGLAQAALRLRDANIGR